MADEAQDGTDWPAVRAVYESGEGTLNDICERFGTTRGKLQRRKLAEGWAPRRVGASASRQQIINRMFHLLEQHVRIEETRMTKTQAPENGEKEVAVLGKLASTLEKLIEIDNAEPKAGRPRIETEEIKELRHKLAQRIARLKRA